MDDLAQGSHPTLTDLDGFAQSSLPTEELRAVERHLAACETCRANLQRLAASRPDRFEDHPRTVLYPGVATSACDTIVDANPSATGTQLDPPLVEEGFNNPHEHSASTIGGDNASRIGNYEIIGEIARGGMGAVYKARQVGLNRIVALKMTLAGQFTGLEERKRFRAEAESAAKLEHPGIVPIYDIGEHDGQPYFSMGFIEGKSLKEVLTEGPLPGRRAAEILEEITEAIAYAHSRGIIHRDLKPANVIIDLHGQPRVTDFGLAKQVSGDSELTRTGEIMGTPSFMPPEQATGRTSAIGPLCDVYSLGAMLYNVLTGRPPFQGASVLETLKQVVEQDPVAPRSLNPVIPLDLETICLKCLNKSPASRYLSAGELAVELRRFLDGVPIQARRASFVERSVRWAYRKPLHASLGLLIVLLAIAGPLTAVQLQILRTRAEQETSRANKNAALATTRERLAIKSAANERLAKEDLRRRTYIARMLTIPASWESGDIGDVERLLNYYQLGTESSDLRHFEWHFWSNRLRRSRVISGDAAPVAFYPDGRIAAEWDGADLRFVTQETNETKQQFFLDAGAGSWQFKTSANGSFLMGHQWSPRNVSASIRVWDVQNGRLVADLQGHTGHIEDCAISEDRQRLVSVANDLTLRLWDLPGAREVQTARFSHSVIWDSVAISPDGNRVVASQRSETGRQTTALVIRDAATFQEVARVDAHEAGVTAIEFSPDGQLLASAGMDAVKLWSVPDLQLVSQHSLHSRVINCLAYSPDGRLLVSGGEDNLVILYDISKDKPTEVLRGHSGWVDRVVFTAQGTRIVSWGRDRSVREWEVVSKGQAQRIQFPSELDLRKVGNIAFNPATGELGMMAHQKLVLWDPRAGRATRVITHRGFDATIMSSCSFSPDGRWLAATNGRKIVGCFRLDDGKLMWTFSNPNAVRADGSIPCGTAFSRDGSQVASSAGEATVRAWDAGSGRELHELPTSDSQIVDVAYCPVSDRLAAVGLDGGIYVWNSTSGELLSQRAEPVGRRYAVQFSLDGELLYCGRENIIEVRKSDGLEHVADLRGHADQVRGLTLSPDGARLASCSTDRTVRIWSLAPLEQCTVLKGHTMYVTSLDFSPDGTILVSAGNEAAKTGDVLVWNAVPVAIESTPEAAKQ